MKLWWVVLIFAIVVALVAFSISSFMMTPQYTSKAKVYVDGSQRAVGAGISYNDLTTNERLVSTYIEILSSDSFLREVTAQFNAENPKWNLSYTTVKAGLEMNSANETEILEIKYADAIPERARVLLNVLLKNAQSEVNSIISGCQVNIVDDASLPTSPSSPNVKQNTFIGLFIGVVLGIAVIFIRELLDTRIKDDEDLKNRYNLAVLGIVPNLDEE